MGSSLHRLEEDKRRQEEIGEVGRRWIYILIRNLLESFLQATHLSPLISSPRSRQIREALFYPSRPPSREGFLPATLPTDDRLLILTSLRRISLLGGAAGCSVRQ